MRYNFVVVEVFCCFLSILFYLLFSFSSPKEVCENGKNKNTSSREREGEVKPIQDF